MGFVNFLRAKPKPSPSTAPIPTRNESVLTVIPELVALPPGTFQMGSSEAWADACEKPQHEVRIGYAFRLGKFPVTCAEWDAARAAGADLPKDIGHKDRGLHPVQVTSDGASAYIQFLQRRGIGCRLPTEAEWEYACRAGTTTRWSFGDDDAKYDEFGWDDYYGTYPVGQKKPNPWGLHDMYGNCKEWCADYMYVRGDSGPHGYVDPPTDGAAVTAHAEEELRKRRYDY